MSFIIRSEADKLRAKDAIDAIGFSPVQIVKISDYKRNRSKSQNATFHLWVKLIADHTGYSLDEVKDKIVLSIWPPVSREINVRAGNKTEKYTLIERRSTAKLSIEEMTQLMNAAAIVADQLNIVLPFPDDYLDASR